jgi:hypothetical protein
MGPALAPLTAGETRELLAQRMWNHAPEMGKKMSARGIPWPRFEAGELAGLLAFLSDEWKEPSSPPAK